MAETSGQATPLGYCTGGAETLRRLRELFVERSEAAVCAVVEFPTAALRRFAERYGGGFVDYPDPRERAAFWDEHLTERAGAMDDSVPAAYLSEFDQGLYGGLLGGEVRFLADPDTGWISSMVPPLLKKGISPISGPDATGVAGRRRSFDRSDQTSDENWTYPLFSEDHPWWRRYLRQMDVFAAAGAGRFGISHLIVVDGLNFVFELIGATATYLAMVDDPAAVERAIDFAFELNVRVHEAFFAHAGLVAGGTCSNMIGWAPGRIVSESVDPFHMTGVADFERWGRGPVERMFRHFDGGVLHIHGNGRHLLEAVSTLPGLLAIYLGDDRGYPRAFSILPELKRLAGGVPLVVRAGYDEFSAALAAGRLTGAVQYAVTDAPDADTAARLMDRLRRYRQ